MSAPRASATQQPEVIICDQQLGKGSGIELARSLKELNPEIPILLIAGVMDPPPATMAVDAVMTKIDGAEAFLRQVAALLYKAPQNSKAA